MKIRDDITYMNIHSKVLCKVVWHEPPYVGYRNIGSWNQKINTCEEDEFRGHWMIETEVYTSKTSSINTDEEEGN